MWGVVLLDGVQRCGRHSPRGLRRLRHPSRGQSSACAHCASARARTRRLRPRVPGWWAEPLLSLTFPLPSPLPAARRARRFRGTKAVAEAFAVTHPVAPPSLCPSRWFPSHCRRRRPPGDAVAGLPVARPSSPNLVCHAFLIPLNPSRYVSLPPIYCSALVASCAR